MQGLEICSHEGPFDEEFSALDRFVSSAGLVRHRRSAEYLTWRYRDNPEHQHRVLVARRRGELLAFAVFVVESEAIRCLVDLFGRELSEIGPPLLETVIGICRREKVLALHGYCSEGSELRSLFGASGLRPREKAACVVAYAKPDSPSHRFLGNGIRWSFGQVEWLG
jgi:hypothetical protein